MLPRRIERYLQGRGLAPFDREVFESNELSCRIAKSSADQDDAQPVSTFVCVSSIPVTLTPDAYGDYQSLFNGVDPQRNVSSYQPPGRWLPGQKRFVSGGFVLYDEDLGSTAIPREWADYLLVARDGYIEFGRRAGLIWQGRLLYRFAPLVAWIQRFSALSLDLRRKMVDPCDQWIVLTFENVQDGSLIDLGEGWVGPLDWRGERLPVAIESRVQLHRVLGEDDDPMDIGRWFAERIDNTFGSSGVTPRCYNRSDGPQGPASELPRGFLDFE